MKRSIWHDLIETYHASGKRLTLAITGGGSGVIGRMLQVPGGSASVLEATVPYSATALAEFLGGPPDHYCNEQTARAMAMAAWVRARRWAVDADPHALIGIGLTASLVSARPKRGKHRIHLGVQTAGATQTMSLTLTKGARSRAQEERLAERLAIVALGEACGADVAKARKRFDTKLQGQEAIVRHTQIARPEWTRLLLGEVQCVGSSEGAVLQVVFPGAFNPLHHGHTKMAQIAATRLGAEAAYELSMTNVDKPPLDYVEIDKRLRGIRELDSKRIVLLTAAPTFCQKAAILPGTTFIAGTDTIERVADPKYYDGEAIRRDQAIADIAAAGCRFLVFGRQLGERFLCLNDVTLPDELRAICDEVPEGEFREDVSSTDLRRGD